MTFIEKTKKQKKNRKLKIFGKAQNESNWVKILWKFDQVQE